MMIPFFTAGLTGAAQADTFVCDLDGLSVSFAIDREQFINPQHPLDPPRNKVSQVEAGDATFAAEPFIMAQGQRGFYAKDQSSMMVIQPDGAATYIAKGTRLTGTCEEQ